MNALIYILMGIGIGVVARDLKGLFFKKRETCCVCNGYLEDDQLEYGICDRGRCADF